MELSNCEKVSLATVAALCCNFDCALSFETDQINLRNKYARTPFCCGAAQPGGTFPPRGEQLLKFFSDYISRIWPWAMIAIGVAITAAWVFFLAFGFVKLVELAM